MRTEILTNIATILFTRTKESDPTDAYRILYGLAGHGNIIHFLLNVPNYRCGIHYCRFEECHR